MIGDRRGSRTGDPNLTAAGRSCSPRPELPPHWPRKAETRSIPLAIRADFLSRTARRRAGEGAGDRAGGGAGRVPRAPLVHWGTGAKLQHFLRWMGITRSYLFLNTFLYSPPARARRWRVMAERAQQTLASCLARRSWTANVRSTTTAAKAWSAAIRQACPRAQGGTVSR
jgi:hypothetical protein